MPNSHARKRADLSAGCKSLPSMEWVTGGSVFQCSSATSVVVLVLRGSWRESFSLPFCDMSSSPYRITYSHSPSSTFHRQVLQPLSLRVQTGLQLRPQGLNIFPLVFFGHQAVLRTFFSFPTLFSRDGSFFPLLFAPSLPTLPPPAGAPEAYLMGNGGEKGLWSANSPYYSARGGGGGDSALSSNPEAVSSSHQDVSLPGEDADSVPGLSAGPSRRMPASHVNTAYYPSSPASAARGTDLVGRRGGGRGGGEEDLSARTGFSGFASSILSTLTHRFDHRSCLVCIDLQNFASVAFECFTAWAGGTSGGGRGVEPAACCLAPNDSQCR